MPRLQIENNNSKKIRQLTLVLTQNCNLSCTYCYEKNDLRDMKIMDFAVAKEMISLYMEANDEFEGVEIDFFGGEPMLAFPLICEIVEWVNSRNWPKDYRFSIGTNGTILNDDIKNWLFEHRRYLSAALSIDGNKIAHNLTRSNSYDLIHPNISFFMETWPHQPAKMTIIADTIPYVADSVIELEEMGLFFTANIAFEDFWGSPERKSRLLNIYEEQLTRLVDYYIDRPHLFPVSKILTAVPEYLELTPPSPSVQRDCTRFCGAGHEMVAIDVDGKPYPCHRFLPWITSRPAPGEPTNRQTNWKPPECSNCKLINSCPTCAGYNWEVYKDTSFRTIHHCEAYKLEVLASARLEAIRLSRQDISEFKNMPIKKAYKTKKRLEAIWELIENGL